MSIKEQLIAEIERSIAKVELSDDGHIDYKLTAQVNYRAGLGMAINIINKHLEGKVILPDSPTDEMNKAVISRSPFDVGTTEEEAIAAHYEAMISAYKGEK